MTYCTEKCANCHNENLNCCQWCCGGHCDACLQAKYDEEQANKDRQFDEKVALGYE